MKNMVNIVNCLLNCQIESVCCSFFVVSAISIIHAAKADILRPYTFGFGSAKDVDEGVYDLVEAGDLKHLTFEDSNKNAINYWVHIPKDEAGNPIENLPVVLYMHGYSDGGGDNNIAIRYHNAVLFKLIADQDVQERKAIIVVPQTPNAMKGNEDNLKAQWVDIQPDKGEDEWTQWNEKSWDMDKKARTDNLNAVVELVKKIQVDNHADVDRAYVTGISMGGYATWDLISRNDDHLFAAAVPICGVGDPSKIENVKDTPVRTFHGGKDPVINPASTRLMYKELRKYGNITYTEYPDEEHPSWNSAYSPVLDDNKNGTSNLDELINWMFNQSKNGTLDGTVDMEPLKGIINDAEIAKEKEYSKTSWEKVQTTLAVAKDCLANNADVATIKEAITNLDKALNDTLTTKDDNIETKKPETAKKDNTSWYILGGVAIVAIIGGIIVVSKRKK